VTSLRRSDRLARPLRRRSPATHAVTCAGRTVRVPATTGSGWPADERTRHRHRREC
jgi:hypothetical protein